MQIPRLFRHLKDFAVACTLAALLTVSQSPASAQSAEGTAWRLVAIDDAAAVGNASLVFGKDGRVSGSASCNNFTGSARIVGGKLRFDRPVASTRRLCVDSALNAQENAVLDMMKGDMGLSYSPRHDRLTLTAQDGRKFIYQRAAVQ
jgi:heat shock protein HslJ